MSSKSEAIVDRICQLEEKFICTVENACSSGLENVDTHEMYEVIDIVKDLGETKKLLLEAEYYKSVVDAMENPSDDIYGYNNNRYMNGRYAPSGRGHRSGYMTPKMEAMDRVDDYLYGGEERMGYTPDSGRYGKAFNEYQIARKHYSSSNSQADKDAMKMHANEHLNDAIVSIRDIWSTADPELKRTMKSDLMKLVGDMEV